MASKSYSESLITYKVCTRDDFNRYNIHDARSWPFYPIMMPLNKDGNGPEMDNKNVTEIKFEVWDMFCNTHGSHSNMPDAINHSTLLNEKLMDMLND